MTPPTARCCSLTPPFPSAVRHRGLDAVLSPVEVQETYTRIAPVYDLWAVLTERRAQRRALALAAVADGERVLEVAVGTGLTFAGLVAQNPGGLTVGLDLTEEMLRRARRRLAGAEAAAYRLMQGDAFALPFPDGHFDLLVNQYMFDLIPYARTGALVAEFRRVLRPEGRLVLTNMTEPEHPLSHVYPLLYRLSPRAMGGCRPVRLAPHLRAGGFTVERREVITQLLFPSEVVVARR